MFFCNLREFFTGYIGVQSGYVAYPIKTTSVVCLSPFNTAFA